MIRSISSGSLATARRDDPGRIGEREGREDRGISGRFTNQWRGGRGPKTREGGRSKLKLRASWFRTSPGHTERKGGKNGISDEKGASDSALGKRRGHSHYGARSAQALLLGGERGGKEFG